MNHDWRLLLRLCEHLHAASTSNSLHGYGRPSRCGRGGDPSIGVDGNPVADFPAQPQKSPDLAKPRSSPGPADVPGEQVARGAVQVAAAAVIAPGGARRGVPHAVLEGPPA